MIESLDWKGIVLHHSETTDSGTQDWSGIRKYHMEVKGWRDIGYHFGIEVADGQIVLQKGRSLTIPGAHCKGLNHTHLGICMVGNYNTHTLETDKSIILINLLDELITEFSIKINDIIGHWESYIILGQASSQIEAQKIKTCPGLMFDMPALRLKLMEHIL